MRTSGSVKPKTNTKHDLCKIKKRQLSCFGEIRCVELLNKVIFLAILISFLIVPAFCVVSDASELLVDHTLSSPEIFTLKSGQQPNSSTVTVKVAALESSQPRVPIDVILALDSSGSMNQSDHENIRVDAAKKLVNMMNPAIDKIGVVVWNDTIVLSQPLTDDFGKTGNQLAIASTPFGGTCMGEALNTSIALLSQDTRNASKMIIFLSDGREECGRNETPCGAGLTAKKSNILIYTVGLGSSADQNALKCISSASGASYYYAQNSAALVPVFSGISRTISNIAAKDVVLRYAMPSQLQIVPRSITIDPSVSTNDGNTILTWNIGAMETNQTWQVSFGVNSNEPGVFSLGISPNSTVTYTQQNGTNGNVAIPTKELQVKLPDDLDLSASTKGGSVTDNVTKVQVIKDVIANQDKSCPDVKLTLKMPDKPANLDIVLAIDTSGSMTQLYNPRNSRETYIDWAQHSLKPVISHYYPNAKVSIVTWDDFTQKNVRDTPFYDVRTQWPQIESNLNNLSEECKESDTTEYSIGVMRAVQKLDSRNPPDPFNTARIIVFITGLSEFLPQPRNLNSVQANWTLENQIANAVHRRNYGTSTNFNGYQIYPVTIGIDPGYSSSSWEYANLTNMAVRTQVTGQPSVGHPISIDKITDLDVVLSEILKGLKNGPLAFNVTVTDSLYPYLNYRYSENSRGLVPQTNYPQKPTTLMWDIGTMYGNEIWTAVIHTNLGLDLPVDVTRDMTPVQFNVNKSTPISQVIYRWYTGSNKQMDLPEGRISVSCGVPCPVCPDVSSSSVKEKINGSETDIKNPQESTTAKKQPGFEALFAAMGLSMAGYLYRRRMH